MAPEFSATAPFSFVLFGASGNLAKLKIYPALYTLALKKRLPKDYVIVGFSRTPMTDEEFRALVRTAVIAEMIEVNESVLSAFLSHLHYHSGQYDNAEDFALLERSLSTWEEGWGQTVRLAYLSIPPSVFQPTVKNLCIGKIRKEGMPFRCIVEKPVGHDLKSFEGIRTTLLECFPEDEIYLLDHYLGKEAVRNVYYLRFANPVLERLFKNTLVHHVEITAAESLGLEGRGFFQSHLLMIVSLLTMRLREENDSFRDSRKNALEQIYLPAAAHLSDVILQGQYTAGKIGGGNVSGYREEEGIDAHSRTNTYAALKLLTRISRWEGIPFYLRSGKRLARKETRISVEFQETHPVGPGSTKNRLDIILQGEAGMRFYLQTKIGGTEPSFRPLIMSDPLVCFGDCLPEHSLLLLEAIHGKQQWFLTFEEVRSAWRLIDPLQAHLDKPDTPLPLYPAGSNGPVEAEAWMEREGVRWME